MGARGKIRRATDRCIVLVGGAVETEDDDSGLGDCRVGGHRRRGLRRGRKAATPKTDNNGGVIWRSLSSITREWVHNSPKIARCCPRTVFLAGGRMVTSQGDSCGH